MYRVEWAESGLNELAQLWMTADSTTRNDITRVTNEIDFSQDLVVIKHVLGSFSD